ncbi:DUF3597 domain-containing protein [Hansschlegelia quercus]|uniref:DUF3597 domain-containing protein n=1 Tax=Hansschlegelia quercus TaxID=2528245 RepID=A0A4Q9GFH5_9HYPH|nr:DUF3597 domain-containing protein [Hansschlegelia quercus]TBN47016.1 DUF3597 domain-containing protein [Hansschlegelia quercus]
MSIFETIKNAIFGSEAKASEAQTSPATPAPTISPSADRTAAPTTSPSASPAATSSASPQSSSSEVDVAAVLDGAVAKSGQKLDWRHSIVDLMKALGLDSSLSKRHELAEELGYSGDKSDSAALNVWLHKQVIAKLKANGGKVPADLA